jgi:hypothetical protein
LSRPTRPLFLYVPFGISQLSGSPHLILASSRILYPSPIDRIKERRGAV